ncbi:MAG: S41 family peptidase [Desulfovibrionaceae bacterium]|jgi:carboxyl-terminal processing protease|nr:S41 family peptidase [Desulfovibrionaceae bacterium]
MRLTILSGVLLLLLTLTLSSGPCSSATGEGDYDSLKRFSQVLDMVERYYVRDVTRQELIDGALRGMVQELDPHSMYMDRDEFEDMQVSTSGEFSGIGIEISQQNGRLLVVSPIEDTPAYDAGLKAGDLILEIEGESTQELSLLDAVKKIRGPKGSAVNLTILHKDADKPERVSIVRDTIPILSVKSEQLENGYGYLRLTRFNEHTTEDMHAAIGKFKDLKGLVLDLRNNPGGLLDQAVSVADTFLSKGMVVYIQGRDPNSRKDFTAAEQPTDVNVPLVVLINAGSASASEIVAGALKDHKRGLLLGERTFGKGSVQTIIPMPDGSGVKLTTALYYTPSGTSIQAEGIEPDLRIPFEAPAKEKIEELNFQVTRERDLSGHLANGNGREDGPADKDGPTDKDGKASKSKDGASEKARQMLQVDNQLRLALQLVKNLPRLKSIQ